MTNEEKKAIHNALKRALVKIHVAGAFKGTGFFISAEHVLTAYHCVGNLITDQDIMLTSEKYGTLKRVHCDREKSFYAKEIDIAVLQVHYDMVPIYDYLPLGLVQEQHQGDKVVIVGYPQEHYLLSEGKISGFRGKHQLFLSDATKGEGQSGSPVYHYESGRVIGITLAVLEPNYMIGEGLAGRFDELFEHFPELQKVNQIAVDKWNSKSQESKNNQPFEKDLLEHFPELQEINQPTADSNQQVISDSAEKINNDTQKSVQTNGSSAPPVFDSNWVNSIWQVIFKQKKAILVTLAILVILLGGIFRYLHNVDEKKGQIAQNEQIDKLKKQTVDLQKQISPILSTDEIEELWKKSNGLKEQLTDLQEQSLLKEIDSVKKRLVRLRNQTSDIHGKADQEHLTVEYFYRRKNTTELIFGNNTDLQSGDEYLIKLTLKEEKYLYVLQVDKDFETVYLLYPTPNRPNPLQPGQNYIPELPKGNLGPTKDDKLISLDENEKPGRKAIFCLVVSASNVQLLEELLRPAQEKASVQKDEIRLVNIVPLLSPNRLSELKQHLEDCADCVSKFTFLYQR